MKDLIGNLKITLVLTKRIDIAAREKEIEKEPPVWFTISRIPIGMKETKEAILLNFQLSRNCKN